MSNMMSQLLARKAAASQAQPVAPSGGGGIAAGAMRSPAGQAIMSSSPASPAAAPTGGGKAALVEHLLMGRALDANSPSAVTPAIGAPSGATAAIQPQAARQPTSAAVPPSPPDGKSTLVQQMLMARALQGASHSPAPRAAPALSPKFTRSGLIGQGAPPPGAASIAAPTSSLLERVKMMLAGGR